MTRSVFLVVCLAAALAPACATAPAKGPAKSAEIPRDAASYYPLEPGWKWAYDVDQDGEAILATYAVISREGARVTLTGGQQVVDYVVKPDGILRTELDGRDGDYLLRAPLSDQAKWPLKGGNAKIIGWNQVIETPAGRFEGCLTVEELRENPDRRTRTTYAPGVGPIRIEFEAMDASGLHSTKAVLRGYTRPGQDPLAVAP